MKKIAVIGKFHTAQGIADGQAVKTNILAEELEQAVRTVFDMRPAAIIRQLDLRKPIYRPLAAYGHMGREDLLVAWEKTDRKDALQAYFGI